MSLASPHSYTFLGVSVLNASSPPSSPPLQWRASRTFEQSGQLLAQDPPSRLTRSTCVAQLSRPQLVGSSPRAIAYQTLETFQKRGFQQNATNAQQAAAAVEAAEDVFDTPPQQTGSAKPFDALDTFPRRHIGPSAESAEAMLKALDPPASSLDEFVRPPISCLRAS